MMPMADWFAPDINFTPVAAVYPTANGGTLASAAAAMSPNTTVNVPGNSGGRTIATDDGTGSAPGVTTSGHSVSWWVGFLVFLGIMVWIARKAGGEEDFRNIRPTLYNFLTITLTAIVGIVGLKVIAAKWRVPGASDIILAA